MGGAALKCFEALLLWMDGADDMSSALGHFNVTLSEIQSIFSEHDVNANSKLDFEEFVAFLSKRTSSLQVSCDAGAAGPAAPASSSGSGGCQEQSNPAEPSACCRRWCDGACRRLNRGGSRRTRRVAWHCCRGADQRRWTVMVAPEMSQGGWIPLDSSICQDFINAMPEN